MHGPRARARARARAGLSHESLGLVGQCTVTKCRDGQRSQVEPSKIAGQRRACFLPQGVCRAHRVLASPGGMSRPPRVDSTLGRPGESAASTQSSTLQPVRPDHHFLVTVSPARSFSATAQGSSRAEHAATRVWVRPEPARPSMGLGRALPSDRVGWLYRTQRDWSSCIQTCRSGAHSLQTARLLSVAWGLLRPGRIQTVQSRIPFDLSDPSVCPSGADS